MEWWQIVLIFLAAIVVGAIFGVLLSYLILRFIKRNEPTSLNSIMSWFVRKPEPTPVLEKPLKLTRADLLAEIEHNRKIATKPMTDRAILFQSRVWDAGKYEVDSLPANLRDELEQVYIDIHIANSLVSASTEFSHRIPSVDENYRELCTRIARRLDNIRPLIKHSDSAKLLPEPYLASRTIIAVKPRISLMSIEAVIYLLAIAAAQTVSVFYMTWGIMCNIAMLTVIVIHSALVRGSLQQRLLLPLALVPLLRIISLAAPLNEIPPILLYHLSYAPVLVAAVFVVGILGYTPDQVGVSLRRFPIQIVAGLTGIVFGIAEYFVLVPEPMIAKLTLQKVLLPAFVLLMTAGFMQEFVFRGVLQNGSTQAFGGWGIVYVSLLFAVTYIGFVPATGIGFAFIVALFYGWVVRNTGSILGVSLASGICTIALYLIFPFL